MVRPIYPIAPAAPIEQTIKPASLPRYQESFKDILQKEEQLLKISKHAQTRMDERNIRISDHKWQSIYEKVTEAKEKGVTEALVVVDGKAMVVSTKNNTVITALDQTEADSKVFTNINGAILI